MDTYQVKILNFLLNKNSVTMFEIIQNVITNKDDYFEFQSVRKEINDLIFSDFIEINEYSLTITQLGRLKLNNLNKNISNKNASF